MPDLSAVNELQSPHGDRFPACYRRLWMFSAEALALLGPCRVVMVDLDVVVTASIARLVSVADDFVIWGDPLFSWAKYCGALWSLKLGSMQAIWDEFDPALSPAQAKAAKCNGSDQGYLSLKLWPRAPAWTRRDGIFSYKWLIGRTLTRDVRLVMFQGDGKPWLEATQAKLPWIAEHWR